MKWTLIATWKMAAEGMRMAEANLQKSGSADQALETVITAVERDPRFHSVGYSGLPNQVGVVQLDGGYMNGDTLSIGAVGCVEKVASAFKLRGIVRISSLIIFWLARVQYSLRFSQAWK